MKYTIKEKYKNTKDLIYRKGYLYEREYLKLDMSIEEVKVISIGPSVKDTKILIKRNKKLRLYAGYANNVIDYGVNYPDYI